MKKYFLIFILVFSSFLASAEQAKEQDKEGLPKGSFPTSEEAFGSWLNILERIINEIQTDEGELADDLIGSWRFLYAEGKHKAPTDTGSYWFPRRIDIEFTGEDTGTLRMEEALSGQEMKEKRHFYEPLRVYSYPFWKAGKVTHKSWKAYHERDFDRPVDSNKNLYHLRLLDQIVFIGHEKNSLHIEWVTVEQDLPGKRYTIMSYVMVAKEDKLTLIQSRFKSGTKKHCYALILEALKDKNERFSIVRTKEDIGERIDFKLFNTYANISDLAENCISMTSGNEYSKALYQRKIN